MPSERVAAIRKMLATQEGQDLIRLLRANSHQEWVCVMEDIADIAESPAAGTFNIEPETRTARNYEWSANLLEGILSDENETINYLTTQNHERSPSGDRQAS